MAAKAWKSCQDVAHCSKPLVPKTRLCYTRELLHERVREVRLDGGDDREVPVGDPLIL